MAAKNHTFYPENRRQRLLMLAADAIESAEQESVANRPSEAEVLEAFNKLDEEAKDVLLCVGRCLMTEAPTDMLAN